MSFRSFITCGNLVFKNIEVDVKNIVLYIYKCTLKLHYITY